MQLVMVEDLVWAAGVAKCASYIFVWLDDDGTFSAARLCQPCLACSDVSVSNVLLSFDSLLLSSFVTQAKAGRLTGTCIFTGRIIW